MNELEEKQLFGHIRVANAAVVNIRVLLDELEECPLDVRESLQSVITVATVAMGIVIERIQACERENHDGQ